MCSAKIYVCNKLKIVYSRKMKIKQIKYDLESLQIGFCIKLCVVHMYLIHRECMAGAA